MFFIMILKFFFFMMIMLTMVEFFYFYSMKLNYLLNFNEVFFYSNTNIMLFFDKNCLMFLLTVLIVVYNVMEFMNIYMNKNKNFLIFLLFTVMFIISMLMLVCSLNIITMIFGWEGLGFSSFYLIFYYNNNESWKSSIKTFINNKLGDSLILMSMLYILLFNEMTFIIFLFMSALMTKSAQYPFMSWLPMAMSAPTPISAMVHSSTLVTAGLYILFRFNNYLNWYFNLNFLIMLCMVSMFFSSLKAMLEKDMKKMIALSTLSQIGLIMFMMLTNFKLLSLLYLCNHAFFKSLLFINMGFMMSSNFSSQFLFNMNCMKMMNLFNISFKISCLNLMNFSFFSSFFIKEMFINQMNLSFFNIFIYYFFFFISFFTMNYSLKFIMFSFKKNFKIKLNMILYYKKNFSFFIFNIISIIFSKIFINMCMMFCMYNILNLILYLFMLMMNIFFLKFFYSFVSLIMYLNFLIYVFPLNFLKKSYMFVELWMENISLMMYFNIFSKTNFLSLKFMNFKMSIFLMLLLLLY